MSRLTRVVLSREEDLQGIVAQLLGDTDIHVLESRPLLSFTSYMPQLDREWQVGRQGDYAHV